MIDGIGFGGTKWSTKEKWFYFFLGGPLAWFVLVHDMIPPTYLEKEPDSFRVIGKVKKEYGGLDIITKEKENG